MISKEEFPYNNQRHYLGELYPSSGHKDCVRTIMYISTIHVHELMPNTNNISTEIQHKTSPTTHNKPNCNLTLVTWFCT